MGACSIEREVKCTESEMTSGLIYSWSDSKDDPYSGDWNTCASIQKKVKVFEKWSEKNVKKLDKVIDKALDEVKKWSSIVLDLGVVGFQVTSLKKKVVKAEKPKYEKMYIVSGEKIAKKFSTKEEAEKAAQELALKNGVDVTVKAEKVLVAGKEGYTTYVAVKTMKKSKPKSVKAGTKVEEIHNYYVVGMAAE